MNELQASMHRVLANTFLMYIKTHSYHWNVVGSNFSQYHEFFGNLYEELHGSIDPIAEHIRAIDGFVMGNIVNYAKISAVELVNDELNPFPSEGMFMQLAVDNQKVIDSLKEAHALAQAADNYGLINFIEDRLDTHAKHGWMLKATVKQ